MSKLPVAYTIDHEGLKLDIALIFTDDLLIHEQTIDSRLENLRKRIEEDGVQSAPILVDRETSVVLDGMHRTAVLKQLGCRFTCICMLNYFDPRIKVKRWCRIIPKPFNHRLAENIINNLDLSMEPYELIKAPDKEESLILVFREKAFKIIDEFGDILETFRRINHVETKLNSWGYDVVHCTEAEAIKYVREGNFDAAIYMPKVSKENVLKVAKRKEVFTPKATRHKLPARPVQVNVPLDLLRDGDISLIDANYKLKEILSNKKVERFEAGKEWNGRIYDEVLYVFENSMTKCNDRSVPC
jgi:hypothetical protein